MTLGKGTVLAHNTLLNASLTKLSKTVEPSYTSMISLLAQIDVCIDSYLYVIYTPSASDAKDEIRKFSLAIKSEDVFSNLEEKVAIFALCTISIIFLGVRIALSIKLT